MRYLPAIVTTLCLGLVVGVVIMLESHRRAQAVRFFESELSAELTAVQKEYGTLKTAYALKNARDDSPLHLEGVDTTVMRDMTNKLEKSVGKLASVQETPVERASVYALYPIRYMRALADAEDARRRFVATATDANASRYWMALETAARDGLRDIQMFRRAFVRLEVHRSSGNAVPSGLITGALLNDYSAEQERTMKLLLNDVRNKKFCLKGFVEKCAQEPARISESYGSDISNNQDYSLARHIAALTYRWLGREQPDSPLYVLSSSSCAENLVSPPYVFVTDEQPNAPNSVPRVRFVSDVVFYASDISNGPILEYLNKSLGIARVSLNPLKFYICPGVVSDVSRVLALREIFLYAQSSSTSEIAMHKDFPSEVVTEKAAFDYLARRLENASTTAERDTLRSLMVQMTDTRRLDAILQEIVRIQEKNVESLTKGIPFDLSAKTLFFTHNALPALYPPVLDTSKEVATKPAQLRERLGVATDLYSDLRYHVPMSELLEDLRKYVEFDGSVR